MLGEAYAVSIELEKQTVRFLDTYNTMTRQQTFKITNKSDHLLSYMCMKNESVYEGTIHNIFLMQSCTFPSYAINYNPSSPTAPASRSLCHPTRSCSNVNPSTVRYFDDVIYLPLLATIRLSHNYICHHHLFVHNRS